MRYVHCLCCGREFRLVKGGSSELAKHVIVHHSNTGIEIQVVLGWMLEDGVFQVIENRRAA